MSEKKSEIQAERIVSDGKVDTWQEINDLPVRSNRIKQLWSKFLNSTSPTIEELEKRSGMPAGKIMARSASHS